MNERQNFPGLVCEILTRDYFPHFEIFSDIINESWDKFRPFFPIKKEMLAKRIDSGNIFVGAYNDGEPVGILETISLRLPEPFGEEFDFRSKAQYICSQIGSYSLLTNNGKWIPHDKDSNVLVFVDITVPEEYRGTPVASGIIDFTKSLLSQKPKDRLEKLENINYAPTFTPNHEPIKRWHKKQNAFDTGVVLKNARPGYDLPDVNFMCYMAPGFLAPIGQKKLDEK